MTTTEGTPMTTATHSWGDIICAACDAEHSPRGDRGQLEELGECDPEAGGWRCPCGALLADRDVSDCLSEMAEDRELMRAGV